VKPQIPGSGKCAGHAGLMGASSRMPARAALDSGIVLARDLAGCRVHEMDAPTSQASHRVMCFFKKGGGRDRNREIGQDRRIKSLPIRTSAILTGAY
jgi:hypothetical protein